MARLSNPLAFTRGPVTIITTLVYLAVITTLIVIHTGVPSLPKSPTPIHGINLTEAWEDLQLLSSAYHPYNSRQNDYVHDWLLARVRSIIANNTTPSGSSSEVPAAYVFEDNVSNLTFSSMGFPLLQESVSISKERISLSMFPAPTMIKSNGGKSRMGNLLLAKPSLSMLITTVFRQVSDQLTMAWES